MEAAETLNVSAVRKETTDDSIYDLQGRRLKQAPAKGVYIKNGKKVMVK